MSRVTGRLLEADAPEGGSACEVEVRADALVALLPGGREVALPLSTLAFERRGFDRDLLAFYSAGTESPWLLTRDPALLEALRRHPRGRRAVEVAAARRGPSWVRQALVPLGMLAALAALAVVLVRLVAGPLLGWALAALPTSVDVELGRAALPAALAQVGGEPARLQDPRVVDPVRRMLEPLVAQVPAGRGFRFEVHVVRHEMVNAFALPGGQLVVTTGLLREAPSAGAVTGVLAHEVTHVTERHGMRSVLERVGLWAALATLLGDVSTTSALLLEQAAALTQLSFSRRMELEADRGGLALLRGAGLDPQGLHAFLRTLQQAQAGPDVPELLSTHPLTGERLQRLEEALAEQRPAAPPRPVPVDFAALQAALAELAPARDAPR